MTRRGRCLTAQMSGENKPMERAAANKKTRCNRSLCGFRQAAGQRPSLDNPPGTQVWGRPDRPVFRCGVRRMGICGRGTRSRTAYGQFFRSFFRGAGRRSVASTSSPRGDYVRGRGPKKATTSPRRGLRAIRQSILHGWRDRRTAGSSRIKEYCDFRPLGSKRVTRRPFRTGGSERACPA